MSTSATKKSRIAWIDLLETLAIFLVILCHNSLYQLDLVSPHAGFSNYLIYFINTIKVIGVPLFFFINGYLLFSKKLDLCRHLKKTIHYIIITIIWAGFALLVLNDFQFTSLSSFLSAKGDIAYLWFMGALIVIYFLFPILKAAYDQNPKLILYFVIMCAIFTFGNTILNQLYTIYSAGILHQPVVHYDVNFFQMFNPFQGIHGYTLVYFCLGGLVYYYRDQILSLKPKTRNLIGVAGIIFGMAGLFLISLLYIKTRGIYWDHIFNGYDTVFAFCLTTGVFLLALNWSNARHPKLNHFFEVASRNTLGIYFLHTILVFLSINFLRTIPVLCNFFGTFFYGVIVFFLSLTISIIMRKIPVIRQLVC